MRNRPIAIGDIHGCSAALDALIDAIRPGPDDTIATLGDYINRGPDSRGVLDRLIALQHHCRLVPLLGKYEEILFEALAGSYPLEYFLGVGGDATLDSYGPGHDPSLLPDEHLRFLGGCLPFHEAEAHIFAHAGYDPELPMDRQEGTALRWTSLRHSAPGPHASGKAAIVGHTSQETGEILDLGHLMCIDTYCHDGGWLTGLEVNSGEVWQADREGRLRR